MSHEIVQKIAHASVAFEETKPGFWDKPSRSL